MKHLIVALNLEILAVFVIALTVFTIISLFVRYFTGSHQVEKLFRSEKKSTLYFSNWQTFEFAQNTLRIGAIETKTSGLIKLGVTNSGIYLGFHIPYYPMLSPVNIPWREIEIQKESVSENYEIIIKKLLKMRIILSPELADRLGSYRKEFEAIQKQSLHSARP